MRAGGPWRPSAAGRVGVGQWFRLPPEFGRQPGSKPPQLAALAALAVSLPPAPTAPTPSFLFISARLQWKWEVDVDGGGWTAALPALVGKATGAAGAAGAAPGAGRLPGPRD